MPILDCCTFCSQWPICLEVDTTVIDCSVGAPQMCITVVPGTGAHRQAGILSNSYESDDVYQGTIFPQCHWFDITGPGLDPQFPERTPPYIELAQVPIGRGKWIGKVTVDSLWAPGIGYYGWELRLWDMPVLFNRGPKPIWIGRKAWDVDGPVGDYSWFTGGFSDAPCADPTWALPNTLRVQTCNPAP